MVLMKFVGVLQIVPELVEAAFEVRRPGYTLTTVPTHHTPIQARCVVSMPFAQKLIFFRLKFLLLITLDIIRLFVTHIP